MAVINVTTTLDENDGALGLGAGDSLREAIIEANTNGDATDTIILESGLTYTLTIAGVGEDAAATGDLDINSVLANANITIETDGAAQATVDAAGLDRVFDVRNGDATLNLNNLIITGGDTGLDGGGIRLATSGATLNVTDSTITGNNAGNGAGGDYGGGIYGNDNNTIAITNSFITDNTSDDEGGGIFVDDNNMVTITGSTISGNMNGDGGGDDSGAGIYGDDNNTFTITDSTITGNTAQDDGGGIALDNGNTLDITGSTISDNIATEEDGGGLFVDGSGGANTITIATTTISGNTAGDGGAADEGGGIFAYNNNTFTITDSTISGNSANGGDGGGFYANFNNNITISNSTFSGNEATQEGGALFMDGNNTTLNISNATIAFNTAGTDGGGIFNNTATNELNIDNTIVAMNMAANGTNDIDNNIGATINSGGFNLIGDNTGAVADFPDGIPNANDDFVGTAADPIDPGLAPLADNGGPTETHALGDGCSLAINNGDPAFVAPPDFDQRGMGFDRVFGDRIDIGAFELQNSAGVRVFGNNANGTPGDDTIVGDAANNRLSGNFGNDNIFGGDGRDTLLGQSGDDFLGGGLGNDRITGGAGADTIDGACGGTGTGEIDRLTGSGGAESDLFVLGSSFGTYYIGNGDADYAYITDFGSGVDLIQLNGVLADYTFMDVTVDNISGRGILRGGDLVAIVQPGTIDTATDLVFV